MNTNKLLWSSLLAVILAVPVQVSAQYDRGPIERRDVQGLEGRWYSNGERDKPCQIFFSRRGLQAKNEQGQTTRLERVRGGNVRALDWENGLRGNVRRDRIEWANGTTWTRVPSHRLARHR
jgi:hypothetical protein